MIINSSKSVPMLRIADRYPLYSAAAADEFDRRVPEPCRPTANRLPSAKVEFDTDDDVEARLDPGWRCAAAKIRRFQSGRKSSAETTSGLLWLVLRRRVDGDEGV